MSKRTQHILAYTYSFLVVLALWIQSGATAVTHPQQGIVTTLLTPLAIYFLNRGAREYARLRRDYVAHPIPRSPLGTRMAFAGTLFLFIIAILSTALRAAATAVLAQGGI